MKNLVLKFLVLGLLFSACKNQTSNGNSSADEQPEKAVLQTEEVTYHTDSTNLKGYLAFQADDAGKKPGVLVIHEWWGHNEYTRKRADMLAELGYVALAVDMYGDGKQAHHPDDAGKFSSQVMSNLDEATARFNAALQLLKNHPEVDPDKIAAIGYCFGGSVALTMANSGADLDAVAAFHSGVALPVMPNEQLKAKVLVCNGAADPFVSEESVAAYKMQMDALGADYQYIAYPDAVHAFTSPDADSLGKKFNLPLAYQEEADAASWEELKKLLRGVFGS